MTDLFDVRNTRNVLSRDIRPNSGTIPYLCAKIDDNSVSSYISYDSTYLEEGNCIYIGGKTFVVTYQERDFFSNDSHNLALYLKNSIYRIKAVQLFIACCIQLGLKGKYSWNESISYQKIQEDYILLPTKDGMPDYELMKKFIDNLEWEKVRTVKSYLKSIHNNDFNLSNEEKIALAGTEHINFERFNLKNLFGAATRGKRLKSSDRIPGELPFVTAGESQEGISDFIGNDVQIFPKNTITIDMFGSAKYRNYAYGCDDHIAVVHTDNISQNSAIFITSAIHKASHNGQFNYGNNFYAKDANELEIMLPTKEGRPDYAYMDRFIAGLKKIMLGEVEEYINTSSYDRTKEN